jgi:hypothetical protein
MSSKIDLRDVFRAHFATLRNASTERPSPLDLAVFFALPALAALIVFFAELKLTTSAIGILIGALSILGGLLINVLVLLYTVKEVGPTETETEEQRALIKEVNANLLYAITIAVLDIVLLCIVPLLSGAVEMFATYVIVAVLGNFVLTLLMALKRLKVLLDLRFRGQP